MIEKFILGLLIFGVGGLTPITYLTPYSPHQLPPYFVSISPTPARMPGTLPAEVLELFSAKRPAQQATLSGASIAPINFALKFAYSTEISLKHGYPLPTVPTLFNLLFLVQRPFLVLLFQYSAWLPPPDHPPRFFTP